MHPSPALHGLADYLRKQADNLDVFAASHRVAVSLVTLRSWAAAVDTVPACQSLAPPHKGMKVDYTGMLKEAARELRSTRHQASAYMLDELRGHLAEMGERFYAGDLQAVDEFLQLYCVARDKRPSQPVPSEGAASMLPSVVSNVGQP